MEIVEKIKEKEEEKEKKEISLWKLLAKIFEEKKESAKPKLLELID